MLASTQVMVQAPKPPLTWNRKTSAGLFRSTFQNQSAKVAPFCPTTTTSMQNLSPTSTAIQAPGSYASATKEQRDTTNTTTTPATQPVLQLPNDGANSHLAIDCEMVGVGLHAHVSVLARVSIVNLRGDVVYDQFVRVEEKVTDYRTSVSGIRKEDLATGISYGQCRAQVRKLLANKILVGHGLQNDLAVLNLRHAPHMIRDTSLYWPYMKDFGSGVVRSRSLRDLAREFCSIDIQGGEHCSIEDARAAMALYVLSRVEWDEYTMAYQQQQQHQHQQLAFFYPKSSRGSSSSSRKQRHRQKKEKYNYFPPQQQYYTAA